MNEYKWYDGEMLSSPYTAVKATDESKREKNSGRIIYISIFLGLLFVFVLGAAMIFGTKIFDVNFLKRNISAAFRNNIDNVITVSPQSINTQQASATLPSVVNITNSGEAGGFFGQSLSYGKGTGVILSEDGYILTSLYVIEEVGTITVELHDGTDYEADIYSTDVENNIALLKIKARNLIPVELGDSSKVKLGDPVSVVGNRVYGNLSNPITGGTVCGIDFDVPLQNGMTTNIFQIDASTLANSLGGLVFNDQGELIGISTAMISSSSENIGFATPINDMKESMQKIVSTETEGTQSLTIGIAGIAESYGVVIDGIAENSPAEKAGLKVNDLIIKVNDIPVSSVDAITEIKNSHQPGDTLVFSIIRSGESISVNVILE